MRELSVTAIYEKAYQRILQRTASSDLYKKLIYIRYHQPKGYRLSDSVFFDIATSILGAVATNAHYLFENPLLLFNVELCNHFVENNCKPYWVDKDFFDSIKNAGDFDLLSNNLPSSIACGALLFPTELSPKNPEGNVVDWVVFALVKSGESLCPFGLHDSYQSEPLSQNSVVWTTMAADSSCYGATILADGMIYTHLPVNYVVTPEEHRLVCQLSHIILHALQYVQNPEYETVINPAPRKLGFGKDTKIVTDAPPKFNPKWIGREIKVYPRVPETGTNAVGRKSPCEHERKEHTRTVRYGKGRSLAKTVTIPATIVSMRQEHLPLT